MTGKLFPYSSPEARTAAGEMLVRGQWSLTDPENNPKPKSPPLDELLWDIGRALGRDQGDLRAAHDLIPEEIAPRTDRTLGEKTSLSERVRDLVNAYQKALEDYRKAAETWFLIDKLRYDEGNSVTIVCDNPDFNGLPNAKVVISCDWTDWQDREFTGETVLDALTAANIARIGAANMDRQEGLTPTQTLEGAPQ